MISKLCRLTCAIEMNSFAATSYDIPNKKRKLDVNGSSKVAENWDDDDDIFTTNELEELELLATQAYNNGDCTDHESNNFNLLKKDVNDTATTIFKTKSGTGSLNNGNSASACNPIVNGDVELYKKEAENLKTSNYALTGEVKILRQNLEKGKTDYLEEKKNAMKQHEKEINSYKKLIVEMEGKLEKSKTELLFKEKERKDTSERLREVDLKKTSASVHSKCKPVLVLTKDAVVENTFSSRFAFNTKKETKNTTEIFTQTENQTKEESGPVLDVQEPEIDAETQLAFRLFNELTIAATLSHQADENETCAIYFKEILLSVKNVIETCQSVLYCKNSQNNSKEVHSIQLDEMISRTINLMQNFFPYIEANNSCVDQNNLPIEPARSAVATANNNLSSQKNYDSNVIFILKFLQLIINYYSQMFLRLSNDSTFDKSENGAQVCSIGRTTSVESSLNLHLGLNTLLETVKIVIEMYSTSQKVESIEENVILELLKVLKEISFVLHESHQMNLLFIPRCGILQICFKLLNKEKIFRQVLLLFNNLVQFEKLIPTFCSRESETCIMFRLSEALIKQSEHLKKPQNLILVMQLISELARSSTGIQLLNSSCTCNSEMIQCFINLLWNQLNLFYAEQSDQNLALVKKGSMLLHLLSSSITSFKVLRVGCESLYILIVVNLARLSKDKSRFSECEAYLYQELWDFSQDDQDEFDFDKAEMSVCEPNDSSFVLNPEINA